MKNISSKIPVACTTTIVSLLSASGASVQAQEGAIWIESQNTQSVSVPASDKRKIETTPWGNPAVLSQSDWFIVQIADSDVEAQVPEAGIVLKYAFNVPEAGRREIWNRIGYETARSPFEWRVDGGEYTRVSREELTTDLMPLAEWNEVAWLKLGERELSAGAHTLEIRLTRETKPDKKYERVNYASDALCIAPVGTFVPNGPFKPGENYRDARDEEATRNTFQLPPAALGARSEVALKGLWEIARHDENLPREIAAPIRELPPRPRWRAINVPGNKNALRPELGLAHRVWYRCRVNVPESQVGRAFYLDFPLNNLNTTVYVNGTLCGFNKNPLVRFQIDVTQGIKAGENEILVGIRDAYYGFTHNPDDPMKLRRMFNLPLTWWGRGFLDFDYPVWNSPQSGILNTPTLVAAGSVYASDVFPKASTAKKRLGAEVTLSNPSGKDVEGELRWQAVDVRTGAVEKTFAPRPFSVPSGGTQILNLSDGWANPTLWWPDAPHLYHLRTQVVIGGKVVDTRDTEFGFRQWGVTPDGKKYTLNGIPWVLWAEIGIRGSTPEKWLASYRRLHQRTTRLATAGQGGENSIWNGLEVPDMLRFMDRGGAVVRRNTSPLDGEVIGYQFTENDPTLKAGQGGSELKLTLMQNWRDVCVAQVRGERNHTSIQIWTIENEFAFINLINLLGNSANMDAYERELIKTSDAVMAADSTRSVMLDGGGATKFQGLPTHGDHYLFNPADPRYPDLAYQAVPQGSAASGRNRWVWDQKRPRFIGEDYFATGINPADYATWGGEAAFLSKTAAKPAAGVVYRMLQEGYRWGGHYAAWHFWLGEDSASNQYGANPWRAVFCRQWDWTFGSSQSARRTWGIFNDHHLSDPLTFTRTLTLGGKKQWSKTSIHTVAPGDSVKFDEAVPMPAVASRQTGQIVLTLTARGKEIYRDVKPISVLPPVGRTLGQAASGASRATRTRGMMPVSQRAGIPSASGALNARTLAVFDPKGEVVRFLRANGMGFTLVNSLEGLPGTARVLVVGRDALSVPESTSSRLAAWASAGRTVIMLDQENSLRYQAIPAEMEPATATLTMGDNKPVTTASGTTGYVENRAHPAFRNLDDSDFFTSGTGKLLYRNAYMKPTRGARSLLQVGPRLQNSALVEVPTGRGVLLLSQVNVGAQLATSAVAGQLLANLLTYGASYRQEFRPTSVVASSEPLLHALDAIGLRYTRAQSATDALTDGKTKLLVMEATPVNLATLAANKAKVQAFTARGGYVVFNGVTPDGLPDYNKLVGYDHMIRPMRRERVTLTTPRDPLTAGLTLGDVVMLSGERINGWTADEYVASDIFSHIVDFEDVAPFGKSTNFAFNNAVSGFRNSDGWQLINNFEAPKTGPWELPFTLPRPQAIRQFTYIGNANYNPQTKVGLVLDGREPLSFSVTPDFEPNTFAIKPTRAATNVTVQIQEWPNLPDKRGLIGIDNISLLAQRPADFYQKVKPMLNVGGLMHYPRGAGGMVLANLLLRDQEPVPANLSKKRTILGAILRNLNAPFAGGSTVIAGANLQYTPVSLQEKANQFRNERGWFGDAKFTFGALPTGRQRFANVVYSVYDFATSPVPNAVALGGSGVPNNLPDSVRGIAVNRRADALFFLHTARLDTRRNEGEIRENKRFEMARYVVTYADGQKVNVPIYAEIDIDDFKQEGQPRAISGAQIAWTNRYEGSPFSAVAYSKQWNNPRPDVEIRTVDLEYGADRRGVPVLLALTAATADQTKNRSVLGR